MIFQLMSRFFEGDFVFTAAGLLAASASLILTNLARRWPTWMKALYFLTMMIGLAITGHRLIEAAQAWWVRPLGEPMHIIIR